MTRSPFCRRPWATASRKAERDGAGGGVAVAFDIDHDFGIFEAEAFLHGLDDAQIGLMGHDERQVARGEAVLLEQLAGDFGHATDGVLEYIGAGLVHHVHVFVHGFMRRADAASRRRA